MLKSDILSFKRQTRAKICFLFRTGFMFFSFLTFTLYGKNKFIVGRMRTIKTIHTNKNAL